MIMLRDAEKKIMTKFKSIHYKTLSKLGIGEIALSC